MQLNIIRYPMILCISAR